MVKKTEVSSQSMAIEEQIYSLVETLLSQTRRGLIRWERMPPGAYSYLTIDGGVRVTSRDNDDTYPFDFVILDPLGVALAEYTAEYEAEDTKSLSRQLADLFREARDSALNITPVVQALLDRLRSNEEPF
jgi:hypothetical protein